MSLCDQCLEDACKLMVVPLETVSNPSSSIQESQVGDSIGSTFDPDLDYAPKDLSELLKRLATRPDVHSASVQAQVKDLVRVLLNTRIARRRKLTWIQSREGVDSFSRRISTCDRLLEQASRVMDRHQPFTKPTTPVIKQEAPEPQAKKHKPAQDNVGLAPQPAIQQKEE